MHALFPAARWQWPQHEAGRVGHPNGHFELATPLVRLA
jgi:hypothetical protein